VSVFARAHDHSNFFTSSHVCLCNLNAGPKTTMVVLTRCVFMALLCVVVTALLLQHPVDATDVEVPALQDRPNHGQQQGDDAMWNTVRRHTVPLTSSQMHHEITMDIVQHHPVSVRGGGVGGRGGCGGVSVSVCQCV
jgi:hypothetical protein